MFRSPITKKRSSASEDEVETTKKAHKRESDVIVHDSITETKRRSRGPRDFASLGMTYREEDYAPTTLNANGAGSYLAGN